jgi:hypothetical protein
MTAIQSVRVQSERGPPDNWAAASLQKKLVVLVMPVAVIAICIAEKERQNLYLFLAYRIEFAWIHAQDLQDRWSNLLVGYWGFHLL